ncbi:hypothetical protein ZWY2020_018051 [Hordeum vulgare]|nr:hypothetical protein ZWY2020_018051 [Hordeum vulgare]
MRHVSAMTDAATQYPSSLPTFCCGADRERGHRRFATTQLLRGAFVGSTGGSHRCCDEASPAAAKIPFLTHERTAAAAAGLALDAPSTSRAARQPSTESMESDGEEEAAATPTPGTAAAAPAAGRLKGCPELTVEGDMREMAKTAAWSVSSCKPGNGVASLRDDNLDTYWQ